MSREVRTNQGGSVLSFVIVAVVLLLVVVVGIYLIRRGSTQTQTVTGDTSKQSPNVSTSSPTDEKKSTALPTPALNTPQTDSHPADTSSQGAQVLPQTGPIQTAGSAIILAILVGSIAAYVCSKRSPSSL